MQLLIFPKSKADFNSKNKTFKSVFKGIEYDFLTHRLFVILFLINYPPSLLVDHILTQDTGKYK